MLAARTGWRSTIHERSRAFTVLDIVPTGDAFDRADILEIACPTLVLWRHQARSYKNSDVF